METRIERDHVMTVLQAALACPSEERLAYVRSACSDNESFYHEVTDALDWEERMGSFLKQPMLDFTILIRPFEPGQVLADRFEILREIGEGGMGVVYEAFDRRLQQNIAIKAAKPGFQRLLSPELKAALKVRHHNICLVKEIHTAQTEYGEIDFLAMEFLDGETLAAYLKKVGKLEHEEALDIACQICAGLAEAHHSGILHRDLKSGNIILTKNDDGSRRVVITDFGLAGAQPLPADEMAGTPAYMAPELWRGEQQSKASDVYALGVILYELVTGARPYQREEEAKQARLSTLTLRPSSVQEDLPRPSRLLSPDPWPNGEQPPAPPSQWVKGLNSRWDRVSMGCLEISPAERPQDAGEVLTDLQHEPINKTPFAVAALVMAAVMAVVGLVRPLRQGVMDFIWPPNVRLAVLPYEGPPELAAIGSGALQEAAARIQQLPTERKWPLNKLSRTVVVIPPARLEEEHADTSEQARDVLHATNALKVTVHSDGGEVSVQATVIDLKSQMVVKELSARYTQNDIGAMPAALTGLVARAFRLREPSADNKLSAAATEPYLRGVYFLNRDTYSFDQAITQFEQAARLDPNSALPPAGIALALVEKFRRTKENTYLEQAREWVHTAQSRNPDSVRVLLASATVDSANGQYLKALQDYRRMQELEPRNVDALLGLAETYEALKEPDEAVAADRKAEELDPQYYKPYHLLGSFYERHGRNAEAVEQFRKMVMLAPGLPDSYSALGSALLENGQYAEAEDALQKSLNISETARALNNLGVIRYFQRRYDEAAVYQKRALAYDPNNYFWLINVADNLRWADHAGEARLYYSRARDQARREMTLNPQSAWPRAFFAYSCARLGDEERAEEEIREAVNLGQGDNVVLDYSVEIHELLGERELAIEAFRGLSLAVAEELTQDPDLADFFQDSHVKQQMIKKGGQ